MKIGGPRAAVPLTLWRKDSVTVEYFDPFQLAFYYRTGLQEFRGEVVR